jgi:phospholipase/lecithinase/hemolysin
MHAAAVGQGHMWSADGVHPSQDGYRLLGSMVASRIALYEEGHPRWALAVRRFVHACMHART